MAAFLKSSESLNGEGTREGQEGPGKAEGNVINKNKRATQLRVTGRDAA